MKPSERVQRVRDMLLTEGLNPHRVETAYRHAEEWVNTHAPANTGERGGSSSPTEIEEGQERARVNRLSVRGLEDIPRLAKLLEDTATQLLVLTHKLTALDLRKYEAEKEAGCRSCARTERRGHSSVGGHFAEVYDRTPEQGLCRWCGDYQRSIGELPPVEACDLYHRVSPRAAGLFLAKQHKAA